jgi:hypothetical protein
MIRISVTAATFEAIAATLPFGSAGFEQEPDAKGERQIWLEPRLVDRLRAMRGPGESYCDVIMRLARHADAAFRCRPYPQASQYQASFAPRLPAVLQPLPTS